MFDISLFNKISNNDVISEFIHNNGDKIQRLINDNSFPSIVDFFKMDEETIKMKIIPILLIERVVKSHYSFTENELNNNIIKLLRNGYSNSYPDDRIIIPINMNKFRTTLNMILFESIVDKLNNDESKWYRKLFKQNKPLFYAICFNISTIDNAFISYEKISNDGAKISYQNGKITVLYNGIESVYDLSSDTPHNLVHSKRIGINPILLGMLLLLFVIILIYVIVNGLSNIEHFEQRDKFVISK